MKHRVVARIMLGQYETEAKVEETIGILKEAGFNSLMLLNCRGHCEPAHYTQEQTLERAEIMKRAMARFREAGFAVSINNLSTIGMNLSPPSQHDFGIQPLIDPDGQTFSECFCPLDPKFLEYIDFLFHTWASLRPDEVWVDDDFRYKNKAAQCYCPLHLEELKKATGKKWTRESLVEALREYPPTTPNPLGTAWSKIQKDALLGVARQIAEAVHRVDPEIPVGLMGIFTSTHHYGGTYLAEVLKLFTPHMKPRLRPEFVSYSDIDRVSWSAYWPRWVCDRTRFTEVEALPEYETWPGTQFNHSHQVLRMKYCWGATHGFAHAAESIGWRTEEFEPQFPAFQRRSREIANGISAAVDVPSLVPRGVSLELSEDKAGLNNGSDILYPDSYAAHLVSRLGMPLWPNGGHATILTGNAPVARANELTRMARGGMLLDRGAFNALVAGGNLEFTGGATNAPMGNIPVIEAFENVGENGIAAGDVISMETAAAVRGSLEGFNLPDDPSFRVLSWFLDEHGERLSPATWARDWNDCRMVVFPLDFNNPGSQYAVANWLRKSQVESLAEWAAQSPLPVRVARAADLYCHYRESRQGDRAIIGLANFSNDPAAYATLTVPLAGTWPSWVLRVLDDDGYWQLTPEPTGNGAEINLHDRLTVPPMTVKILELRSR